MEKMNIKFSNLITTIVAYLFIILLCLIYSMFIIYYEIIYTCFIISMFTESRKRSVDACLRAFLLRELYVKLR